MTPLTPNPSRFLAFDLLATLVAVVRSDGVALFANAALEDAMGQSRRSIEGSHFPDSFAQPQVLSSALTSANDNEFAALRYDAMLLRQQREPLPVHVIVAQTERPGEIIIEMLPLEAQARQDREERLIDQAQACGLSQPSLRASLVILARRASKSFFILSHSAPWVFFAPQERRYSSLMLRCLRTISKGISFTMR